MNATPMPDFGWVAMAHLVGSVALTVAIPFTLIAETLVIWKLLHLSFGRSLKDAIAMNIVSGVTGYITSALAGPGMGGPYPRTDYYSPATPEQVIFAFLRLTVPLCLVSTIVEGVV